MNQYHPVVSKRRSADGAARLAISIDAVSLGGIQQQAQIITSVYLRLGQFCSCSSASFLKLNFLPQ
jgi:hypothetical protein